ncbi:hypothetical protein [Thauera sp. SDU_THAU2]|uniref:hypothetical protein n=1 Tax=Thauera sp. SDU_THAU2 TaxID=3136633 RepID=UPI00311F404B
MDFDPVTQRMFFAGGRPQEQAAPQKMVWFDAPLNEWRSKSNWSGIRGGHIYRSTCVIPEHRRAAYIPAYLTDGIVPLWDIDTNTYAGSIPRPPNVLSGGTAAYSPATALVWHPTLGPQGSIVMANKSLSRVARFDWAAQTWMSVGRFDAAVGWVNVHMAGHYNAHAGAAIVGATRAAVQRRLVIVEQDGSTRIAAQGPCAVSATGHGLFVPHPTRSASVSLCLDTQRVWSYEWDTDVWVDRAPLPPVLNSVNVMPATIHELGVIFAAKYGAGGTSKTYVYKPDF